MKVLNLRCSHDHRFEGWFASDEDFSSQTERGLMACPICGDQAIARLPSAPRVNLLGRGDDRRAPSTEAQQPAAESSSAQQIQARWLNTVREMIASTEDVGDRFAEEARRIHYGEAEQRGIRGRASREDADSLRDEGIEVLTLALPEAVKGPLQ
ncbi:MAG TPA: DUF1178 family protein [Burkholderiaceae bacterium]|jgi:hypothetical protein